MAIRDLLRRNSSNIKPRARIGVPSKSLESRYAELIPQNDPRLGYISGGNLVSGLSGLAKGYLGFKGAQKDYENQKAYNDYLTELAEAEKNEKQAQYNETRRLELLKMGFDPDRIDEEGYVQSVLDKKSISEPKGEFGSAMAVIQSPEFKNLPEEQQKLWKDFAATKAKGAETVYNQAFQGALGQGQGQLQTAQDIAREKAIGSELLQRGEGGELTPIKGTKEDAARTEKKEKYLQGMRSSLERSDIILNYIDQAMDLIQNNPVAAGAGVLMSFNPYSDAGKLRSLLASIKGNVGLKELINSKAEGATYGALSEKELEMLQDVMGKIDQGSSPEVLLQVLQNVKNNYSNVRNRAYSALQGAEPKSSLQSDFESAWGK